MRIVACTILLIQLVSLSGCWNNSFKKIDYYIFLNDKSSKVWLVDKLMSEGKDFTPIQFKFKELIVFHESRNAVFYKMNSLGSKPGNRMYYWMDREKNEIGFQGNRKQYLFEIMLLSRTKIILKPKYKSYPFSIVLIPFPEY